MATLITRFTSLNETSELLYSAVDVSIPRAIKTSDLSPVGMISLSNLTEAQFQLENGTSWVLADGRSVTGSLYASVTGSSTVPDCRGMTLRGKNNGRSDGNQDTGGERSLGNFQSNAVPNITGYAWTTYFMARGPATGVFGYLNNGNGVSTTTGGYGSSGGKGWINFDASRYSSVYQSVTEVRVRNVCVNIFIKIN